MDQSCTALLTHALPHMQVPTERILVIYDDLDTPTAKVRLRAKGGHGGHNGIRSLGQHLPGNFPRIKIGAAFSACMLGNICICARKDHAKTQTGNRVTWDDIAARIGLQKILHRMPGSDVPTLLQALADLRAAGQ